jgi:acyl-coenzyme A thioesterase PaaI-like protein
VSERIGDRELSRAAAVDTLGEGRFSVDLSTYWTVMGRPNGGYLQCLLANAAVTRARELGSGHTTATAITTNYVGAPKVGPGEVTVDVRRLGRGVTFAHVRLVEGGELTTESLVTLGRIANDGAPRYGGLRPVPLPPREHCLEAMRSDEVNIGRCVELRLDPSCAGWWRGEVADVAEVRGWIRLVDGAWDTWTILFATDALPPATFPIGSTGWVPTLQLSSYVRAIPRGEWLRARQYCVVVDGNLVDERCELFDDTDRLVASSSQLAMVRFAPEH